MWDAIRRVENYIALCMRGVYTIGTKSFNLHLMPKLRQAMKLLKSDYYGNWQNSDPDFANVLHRLYQFLLHLIRLSSL